MRPPIAKAPFPRLALLCATLLLWASTAARGASPPAFEIAFDGTPVGYLVGTMHSEDSRVLALLDQIAPLVGQVDAVAVELVPDGLTMMAVGAATLLPADQQLSGLIGAERFVVLSRAAEARGLPAAVLERLKPWAAAVTLGMPALQTGQVLDAALYLEARDQGRRVIGLETAAEQIAIFDRMPLDRQIMLLDVMLKNADQLPIQLESLTAAYLSGDLGRLEREARRHYDDVPPAVQRWFDQDLLASRNVRMLSRIMAALAEGRVLIAVGALHLPGPDGLLAGLKERGYSLRRLTETH